MKSKEEIFRFCFSGEKIGSGKRWGVYSLILLLLLGNPLLVFSAGEAENAAQPPDLPLKAASESVIEKRLRAVIGNIDDFQNVKIDVNDGVVRLSGTTPRTEVSDKVAQLVSRFEDVIYVDNQIQVETDVETRVKPALTRVKQYLANTLQKLPIIGVAMAVIVMKTIDQSSISAYSKVSSTSIWVL